jgi:uncharacterized RDD family membrane protein YckC
MFCPECGRKAPEAQKFCIGCGTTLLALAQPIEPPPLPEAQSHGAEPPPLPSHAVSAKPDPLVLPSVASGSSLTPVAVASKGRRLGTFLVDYAGFFLSCLVLGLAIGLVFGERGAQILQAIPDVVLGLVMMFSYYLFFEWLWARTPGKLIFGTIVVTESGGKPSLGQLVKRTLCRFIPFEPLSFLGAQGWHDSVSRTRVILTKR